MATIRGLYCVTCRGCRLHSVVVRIEGGTAARLVVCSACSSESPAPGIACKACGGKRFRTVFTRDWAPGVVMRERLCIECKARWKEITRVARGQADTDPVKV